MSINSVLAAAETLFNSQLNGVKTVLQHGGPMTPQYLIATRFNAPAVFIGASGAQAARTEDQPLLNEYGTVLACRFTAMCVGKHAKSQVAANAQALAAAEQIAILLHRQDFNLAHVAQAYNTRMEPVAAGQNKQSHLSFWRVSWWHGVAINQQGVQSNLDDFMGYDADHFTTDADPQSAAPVMQSQEDY